MMSEYLGNNNKLVLRSNFKNYKFKLETRQPMLNCATYLRSSKVNYSNFVDKM